MLTVAPSGNTKLLIRFEIPPSFSKQSIVTGNVAEEDAVEKAVNAAGAMVRKVRNGDTLPTNLSKIGNVTDACRNSAASTTKAKISNGPAASKPVLATTFATSPKTPIGGNAITHPVIFIITWKIPDQNRNSGSAKL